MESERTTIEQLVKGEFDGLSASQRKVAEYLIHHPDEWALLTAKQISQEVGVSETTVIRLSYALGFGNFSEMQRRLREEVLKKRVSAPISSSSEMIASDETDELAQILKNDISILQRNLFQLDYSEVWKAVDALIKADQVLIAGYRSSYAAAYWFSYALSTARDNVQMCSSGENEYAKVISLTESSLFIIISFPRYSRETLNLANQAKKRNVPILAVTDKVLSPVGRLSDMTLVTDINIASSMISMASVISLLNLLVFGMKTKDQQQFKLRLQRLEQIYTSSDIYAE